MKVNELIRELEKLRFDKRDSEVLVEFKPHFFVRVECVETGPGFVVLSPVPVD